MLANDVRRGMNEVNSFQKDEFVCQIEDGTVYQNSLRVNYTVYFRYVRGQNFSVYTSYRR
jgi:hypothetical protein